MWFGIDSGFIVHLFTNSHFHKLVLNTIGNH